MTRVTDMQYPKSLGEVCLEEWGAYMKLGSDMGSLIVYAQYRRGDKIYPVPIYLGIDERQALRRAMYHHDHALVNHGILSSSIKAWATKTAATIGLNVRYGRKRRSS